MTPQIIAAGFPVPPARGPEAQHATRYIFGAEVLVYILAAAHAEPPCEVYGLLTDQDLEDAQFAAGLAIRAKEIQPEAVDTITQISITIWKVLVRRGQERSVAQLETQMPQQAPPAPPQSGAGTKVLTNPRPSTQPPAPAFAIVEEWSF